MFLILVKRWAGAQQTKPIEDGKAELLLMKAQTKPTTQILAQWVSIIQVQTEVGLQNPKTVNFPGLEKNGRR